MLVFLFVTFSCIFVLYWYRVPHYIIIMTLKEEQILVKQAQKGDREALSKLWDAITPKLFGYLVNTLKDKTLAEDIFQNTWLKVIQALPQFRYKGNSVSSWIFAIARNECRQYWRNNKGEVELLDDQMAEVSSPDANKTTDDRLVVEKILKDLSEDDRELLRLRYIADLPIDEIAKVLNINFVAVRVRLYRAVSRARKLMASNS